MEFEVLQKDLLGRIGRLKTKRGIVETPTLLPVINPNQIILTPEEIKKCGAEMLITNAYIIYKSRDLRKKAREKGVHELLETDMPVMTDSGSYQLSEYGDVEVSSEEIVRFQVEIKSDIIVPLDIPTPPDAEFQQAEMEMMISVERALEALKIAKGKDVAGVIQGSIYEELRERCASLLSQYPFSIYPIGAAVPLLEEYRFSEIVRIIMASKRALRFDAPVHLFGAGHPMFLSLAVAMGCDLFDSAAYALYARDNRYLTEYGTVYLEDLKYFPCSCPICSSYTPDELRKDEEKFKLLSMHNLYVTFEELRRVKQAIVEGSLSELIEQRVRAHPLLLNAYREFLKYSEFIEKFDSAVKSSFFYSGLESFRRPEVIFHEKKLKKMGIGGRVLITTCKDNIKKESYDYVMLVKIPFGVLPEELDESYPAGQSLAPENLYEEEKRLVLRKVLKFIKNSEGEFTFLYDPSWELEEINEIKKYAKVICSNELSDKKN
jgi:7-cyano-7-deazaguanine tRNA-ribosyltransferase